MAFVSSRPIASEEGQELGNENVDTVGPAVGGLLSNNWLGLMDESSTDPVGLPLRESGLGVTVGMNDGIDEVDRLGSREGTSGFEISPFLLSSIVEGGGVSRGLLGIKAVSEGVNDGALEGSRL